MLAKRRSSESAGFRPPGATTGTASEIAAERNPLKKAGRILGPGFITGASDDDPSGIGTYAAAPLNDTLVTMFFFFVKAGALVFGSGLAIVPFLHQRVVQEFGWLNEHQFLDAVAVAIITPGPVVITVAFIGYLTAGLLGAIVAALGMFLPVYLFTIGPVLWFKRNRNNPQLKAFVTGATAAATGAIAGAVVVLGQRAIVDIPTALVALASLGILLRFKVPEPLVISVSGAIGLALWPLLGKRRVCCSGCKTPELLHRSGECARGERRRLQVRRAAPVSGRRPTRSPVSTM